ncbi:MAG: hypothetical protein EOO05_11220 [Chitinophagaceae bacterium]|nr:MAG: hypothetical protein EOO05_11220 [Chitinophagaceae bacterium]
MAVHMLKAVQRIPGSPAEIWEFFSNPANLATITPAEMDFRVISDKWEKEIYPGQIIEYTVRPVFGIPFYWMTEITQVQSQVFFIDEQRKGPYSLWHHQHHFEPIDGGMLMTDMVHYSNPMGFLGEIANAVLVKKKLRELFEYRVKKIEEKFGEWGGATVTIR